MKKQGKIVCAVLTLIMCFSFAACDGSGSGVPSDLDKGYTYTKQNNDGLMQFYSSDSGLDAFLNDYMERHLRYSDKAVGTMRVGETSTPWKEWEAMSVMWMNTGAIGYSPKESVAQALTNIYQDEFGYIWMDNGTSLVNWGQSWEFPNARHSGGKNHTYFGNTAEGSVTDTWEGADNNNRLGSRVPVAGTARDYLLIESQSGGDITSATFQTVSGSYAKRMNSSKPVGDMAVAFHAPFVEINLSLLDEDSLGHSTAVEDIELWWQTDGASEYDTQHMVKYSEFSSTPAEYFPVSSRIVFPMYAHAGWGTSETRNITGMKIVVKFKRAFHGQVKLDRVALAYDGRQVNNNGVFIAAAAETYKFTQDNEWLEKNIGKFRKAMQFLMTYCGIEGDELITTANFVGHDGSTNATKGLGRGHGIGDGYWDCISNPCVNSYVNMYYFKALKAMEYLERVAAAAGIEGESAQVFKHDMSGKVTYSETEKTLAEKIDAFIPRFREYFWNDATGRFALGHAHPNDVDKGTVDEIVDYGFTKYNQEAIELGLASDEQTESILSWINGSRSVAGDTSTGADLYKYAFAPRWTTKANTWQFWWNMTGGGEGGSGLYAWDKQIQNGGTSLQCAYYDLAAELVANGADSAFGKLKNIQKWYEEVTEMAEMAGGGGMDFYNTYYEVNNIKLQGNDHGGAGVVGVDSEFIEATLLYAAVPYRFFGLDSETAGVLSVTPAMPSNLTFWKMENLTFGNIMYDLSIGKNFIQLNSVSGENNYKVKVTLDKPAGNFQVRQHNKILTENTDYTVEGDKVVITVPLCNGRIQTVTL